jgi:DNA modification methylase
MTQLSHGDCREVLPTLTEESIHCVVTSPPYWGLRDYGVDGQMGLEETPEAYVAALVAVLREVQRVLRADGTLWLNLGDCYASSWPSSRRRRMGNGSLTNGKREARPERLGPGLKDKDLVGIPWRLALALQADGWWLRADIIWSKPNPMPESVRDRPTRTHEYLFLLTKQANYYYDADAIREPHAAASLSRWRPGRTWNGERQRGRPRPAPQSMVPEQQCHPAGRNKRSVWEIATQPTRSAHLATFPEALVQLCILAGCPEGGVVLDPFAGTGTVGRVAADLGRHSILIELNRDYIALAQEKTAQQAFLWEQSDEAGMRALVGAGNGNGRH